MDFAFTPEEEAFRQEVRRFLEKELTPEVVEEVESGMGLGPHARQFLRKMGAKGWLCPSWPRQYGGLGGTYVQRFIIKEEVAYYGGPHTLVGVDMAGPTILLFGSEELKQEYLPRIAGGEVEFALGYTEPQAGSDLAALEIRAVEEGDYFVMNGQKMFNTACHYAEYHWLGARTDPTVAKHRGISLFVVDLNTPGITIRPLWTMAGWRTNEVFYDNVKVPKKNLVGEKNRGWYHIATALDFERTYTVGQMRRLFEKLVQYCRQTKHNGEALSKNPLVRHKLAELAIEIEIAYLFACRIAWMLNSGTVPNYEAAMVKAFGSELEQRLANAGTQILGLYGQLQSGSKWVPLGGSMEYRYRETVRSTITRGTSEVMRNIVALRGLGLPRE